MTGLPLDLAGIGIGPFNLSLAAQLDAVDDVEARFFDSCAAFDWHPGMMLPDVTLQTSFLKDLVTATNPTSPWSFLAYLVAHKRFYEFLNAEFAAIPRREFANYLAWVAGRLSNLQFGTRVEAIAFDGRHFRLEAADGPIVARNVALGVGLRPVLPAFAAKLPGSACFHSSRAAFEIDRTAGRRVAVIGGGQSGAEIVLNLLERGADGPAHIDWISLRPNFQPLDESPFTNELFTPQYVGDFHHLPEARRRSIVERDKLAGDGVSAATLAAIYRRLYVRRHVEGEGATAALLPHREVLDIDQTGGGLRLVMRNGLDGRMEFAQADIVIMATGYAYGLPDCLAPLAGRLALDSAGRLRLGADFAVEWDGPRSNRLFALNAGLISHGIAEPQLSLMAWRSAVIANAVAGKTCFDVDVPPGIVDWTSADEAQTAPVRASP